MTAEIYDKLGVDGVEMAVSTRPDEFLVILRLDVAEKALIEAVERAGSADQGKDAAFYAPARGGLRTCSAGDARDDPDRQRCPVDLVLST